jgi:lipopolysaccharide transport system permease protein
MNQPEEQIWTDTIDSKHGILDVDIKEVWRYRDLLMMLVKKDYVTFYKQTILGPIWFFVQPILTMLMYMLLFGQIAKLSTDGVPQMPFYLAGIIIWNYFSEALTKTSTVFKDNAAIMGKVYFPRLIMPLSIVVSGLMKFVIQFLLFVVVVLYYTFINPQLHPNVWVFFTPILIVLMALLSLGVGMIFSSLTIKYKDLVFLLTFGIQLFMYITPVVYSMGSIPIKYQWLMELNPLTGIFECFRYAYLGVGSFDWMDLVKSTLIVLFFFATGVLIFNKVEKSFMDTV